ncbi:MAG: GTPase HflX [Zestosphaera tikiterensis]|uniref:GTPase HflX n=1 Tax=Zestosphaera tikiterensis TaxID=1973259 RepID=A0A2R7Y739_9CREN|nr:MAG: GTPase HflX [Zestosphaera tikiterensis]
MTLWLLGRRRTEGVAGRVRNGYRKNVVLISRLEDLSEARALVETLNFRVVDEVVLKNSFKPNVNYFLDLERLKALKDRLDGDSLNFVNSIYIYEVLHPRQTINLIKEFKREVKDKISLILEIFAEHAGSKEAKLQIEMAEILHQLPIVKEWIRKAKLGELPGFMGPGEYATDVYYNHMRRRLVRIRRELKALRERRLKERVSRTSAGFPQVAISGYANAGKTTLFNLLTGSNKPVGPEMFTTVSPKVSTAVIEDLRVAFVDTVGFIKGLPHEVIEAFYATLEEIATSKLTVLVVDASEDLSKVRGKVLSSLDILSKIGYFGKPLVVALNKVDLLNDVSEVKKVVEEVLSNHYMWSWRVVSISALKGFGVSSLKNVIYELIKPKELSVSNA